MELVPGLLFARLGNRGEPPDRRHIWIILSDPLLEASNVLLVNFTDALYWVDDACEFQAGELQAPDRVFLKTTRVAYRLAETHTLDYLREEDGNGLLDPRGKALPEVLKRIRMGAWNSIYIADEHLDLLEAQGLGRDDL